MKMKIFDANMKFFVGGFFISQTIVFSSLYSMEKSSECLVNEDSKEVEVRDRQLFRSCCLGINSANVVTNSVFDKVDKEFICTYDLTITEKMYNFLLLIKKSSMRYSFVSKTIGFFVKFVNGKVELEEESDRPNFERFPGLEYAAQMLLIRANKDISVLDFGKKAKSSKKYSDVTIRTVR
jgi:hypothetical protein